MGSLNRGFSLVEILLVLALLAIVGTIVVPNFSRKQPLHDRQLFLNGINGLMRLAWHNALVTGRVHRVQFSMQNRTATVLVETEKKDTAASSAFARIKNAYVKSVYQWPAQLSIKQFFIEGVDEVARYSGGETNEVWFFVMPDGLTQSVVINVTNSTKNASGKARSFGLVLNPFSAQFDVYDSFQKP